MIMVNTIIHIGISFALIFIWVNWIDSVNHFFIQNIGKETHTVIRCGSIYLNRLSMLLRAVTFVLLPSIYRMLFRNPYDPFVVGFFRQDRCRCNREIWCVTLWNAHMGYRLICCWVDIQFKIRAVHKNIFRSSCKLVETAMCRTHRCLKNVVAFDFLYIGILDTPSTCVLLNECSQLRPFLRTQFLAVFYLPPHRIGRRLLFW